ICASLIWALSLFPIEKREHQFAFGNDGVVHYAVAFSFGKTIAARFGQLGVNEDRFAGEHWFSKFYAVGAHKVTDPARSFCEFEEQDARSLRHRFNQHHARHDRMPGEMSLEKGLVNRYRFGSDDLRIAVELDHPVDHQERITMRQHLHHLVGAKATVAARHRPWNFQFAPARLFPRERDRNGTRLNSSHRTYSRTR